MTGQQVVSIFRRFIADEQHTRWTDDSKLLPYLQSALNALWVKRKHRFFVERVIARQPALPKTIRDALPVDEQAGELLAHYMCYLAYQEDDEDQRNQVLLDNHYRLFATG